VCGELLAALGGDCEPACWAKASASSGLAKQNTTKSLSSRRREYVSSLADKTGAQGVRRIT
jgi:hypothetical protein